MTVQDRTRLTGQLNLFKQGLAMQHEFWHDKWRTNQIGFHQPEFNKLLLKHWSSLAVNQGTVLVPLCGKSLDLLWLLKQGYQVVGIELSEIALDALAHSLREQLGLTVEKNTYQHYGQELILYRGQGVVLMGGDFFGITPELLGQVDAIYDRAALVALPKARRADYCQHLVHISGAAPQLLLTFDYNQNAMDGPPFSVPAAEVHTHYQAFYPNLEVLEAREIIDHEPKFKERGLSSFQQLVYRLS